MYKLLGFSNILNLDDLQKSHLLKYDIFSNRFTLLHDDEKV
jgi:hypothetical protein